MYSKLIYVIFIIYFFSPHTFWHDCIIFYWGINYTSCLVLFLFAFTSICLFYLSLCSYLFHNRLLDCWVTTQKNTEFNLIIITIIITVRMESRYWPRIIKFYLPWIIELRDMRVLTLQKRIAERTRVLTFTDWKIVSSRIVCGQGAAPPIICVLYFRQKGKLCFIISAGEITAFLPSFFPLAVPNFL